MKTFKELPEDSKRILIYWIDKVGRVQNIQSGYVNREARYICVELDNGDSVGITDNLRWEYYEDRTK